MHIMQIKGLVLAAALSIAPGLLNAQVDFKIAGEEFQVHGFVSQGFMYSGNNNYLSAGTTQGYFGPTDGGVNVSTQITDKFRIGAQVYDFNVGQLGKWHPELDWATADYRFKDWFGIRGGKVKTVFGLYTDTQDMNFLQTFALLPQAIYPIDLRDQSIAHTGGDVYGNIGLKRLGGLSYTGFVGTMFDSANSGYIYATKASGLNLTSNGGLSYGGDLRWNAPLSGLVLGASQMWQSPDEKGICATASFCRHGSAYFSTSIKDFSSQFYGQFTRGKFRFDTEYRRTWHDWEIANGHAEITIGVKAYYTAAAYRISSRLELGSYFSHMRADAFYAAPVLGHEFDKVVTARVDLTKYWNLKVEGHFINGTGGQALPFGFYPQVNPNGYQDKTPLLVVRTGLNF
jgi:hypothetical protein